VACCPTLDFVIDILDGQDSPGGLHGAYTYRFACERLGRYRLRCAVEAGELVGFGRGVLLDARRVLDLRTRCAGALLLTGDTGVVVGPTAAALHGCSAVGGFPVHVRVPYVRRVRSRNGLVVHQGDVPERDVRVLDDLRVLPMDLAVADVLCSAPRRTALACVDQAMRGLRPEDRPGFAADVAGRLAERVDRRGTRRAEALLSLATGLPESPVQSAFVLVLADAGFPRPVCQYPVRDRTGRVRWHLDFAWPQLRVALECDSADVPWDRNPDWYPGRSAEARSEDLRAKGWLMVRAEAADLSDPTSLCIRLRTAMNQRRYAA
jgi:hypothetical protein